MMMSTEMCVCVCVCVRERERERESILTQYERECIQWVAPMRRCVYE